MPTLPSPLTSTELDLVSGGMYPLDRGMICHLMPSICRGPFPIEILPIPYPLQPVRA